MKSTLFTIARAQNALALLAVGNKTHQPLIGREAKWAADFSAGGFATRYYGYEASTATPRLAGVAKFKTRTAKSP